MVWYSDLINYAPLIELVAGINLAYIVVNLSESLSSKFSFKLEDIDDYTDSVVVKDINVDIGTLESREPITSGTNTTKGQVDSLIGKYKKLKERWHDKKEELTKFLNKYKIFPTLPIIFSFVLIYSIIDLLLIGYCASESQQINGILYIFNWLSLIVLLAYVIYSVYKLIKRKEVDIEVRYKHCIYALILIFLISWISSWWFPSTSCVPLIGTNFWISILFPAFAFVFSFVYCWVIYLILKTWFIISKVIFKYELKKLRKRKKKLDDVYKMLSDPDFG